MTTYVFEEVKYQASRNLKCRDCGKRFRRSTTFMQTINPWNKSKETGKPKTFPEIWKELKAEAEAWSPDNRCTKCVDAAEAVAS